MRKSLLYIYIFPLMIGLFTAKCFAAAEWGVRPTEWIDTPTAASPITEVGGNFFLDQHPQTDNGGSCFWANKFLAQTFTPTVSGQLHHVDLDINVWSGTPSVPATISIVETIAGEPSGLIIGSVTKPSLTLGWYSFDFMSESVTLMSGVQYGIVLSNDEPSDGLAIQWDDKPYPGGTLCSGNGHLPETGKYITLLDHSAMLIWLSAHGWSQSR